MNPLSFAFDANVDTPAALAERRRVADILASQIGQGHTYGSGIGDLFRGLGVGLSRYRTNKLQKAGDASGRSAVDRLMQTLYGHKASGPTNILPSNYPAANGNDTLAAAGKSISGIESGNNYAALGPVTRHGDRAYGKYQVMGANIPSWSEAALGQRLTPEEFLAMPKAQEAVFKHRFGGYLKENSPQDAASMWFTGKPLAQGAGLTDQLGTSGQGYADKFMAGLGGNGGMPMVPQLATYTPPQPQPQDQQPQPAGGPMQQAPQMPAQGAPQADHAQSMAPAQPPAMAQMQPAGNDAALIPQIMEVLHNPFISDQDRAFLQKRLEDIQQKQDPAYQLKLKMEQLQYDQTAHPENVPTTALQDAQLKALQAKPVTQPTADIQDYEYAKRGGFKGSFEEYQLMLRRAASVNINNGAVDPNLPPVMADAQGNIDKASQDEFFKALPPDDARLVKGMIDYRADPTKFSSMRQGERQRLVDLAMQADPTFDLSQFKARQAFKQSLTSGNLSQALMSSNLVIQHMDALLDAAKVMDNGEYPILNSAGNIVKTQTGQNAVTNFKTAKKAVAAELAKVFKGVGATDVNSINEWESNFNENSSPEQIKGAVETATKLLASRIDTVKNQYQSTMGRPMDFRFLTPKSEAVLAKRGLDVGGGVPGEPPPNSGMGAAPQGDIPSEAIQMLKNDPSTAAHFDETFGPGSAARILGQ